jgi:hypothetical protein
MSTEKTTQYYNLVAFLPDSDSTEKRQWLHHECEGNLLIGNDGTISCEKCKAHKPALVWYVIDNNHLSETPPELKQLDFTTVTALAGQITSIAGKQWLGEFLKHI